MCGLSNEIRQPSVCKSSLFPQQRNRSDFFLLADIATSSLDRTTESTWGFPGVAPGAAQGALVVLDSPLWPNSRDLVLISFIFGGFN